MWGRAVYKSIKPGTLVKFVGPDGRLVKHGPGGRVKAEWDTKKRPLATVRSFSRAADGRLILAVIPEGKEQIFEVLAGEVKLAKRGKTQ